MKPFERKREDFEAKVAPHLSGLCRTASILLDDTSQVEDLVLEALSRAYRTWDDLRPSSLTHVRLFTHLINSLASQRLGVSQGTFPLTMFEEVDNLLENPRLPNGEPIGNFDNIPLSAFSVDDVSLVTRNLPFEYKMVLVLALQEGFSCREVATIANIPIDKVKSLLYHGRSQVHRDLLNQVVCSAKYLLPTGEVRSKRMA